MDQLECLPYSVGSAQEGVCLLIRMGPYRVLLDCGLSDPDWMTDRELLRAVDLVLCSHAHPDHARGLLALNQAFPQLPICASEVTAQLLPLNWLNQEVPLFCQALPWRSPIEFKDGLTVELYPAGHLPGAAAIFLTYKTAHRTYSLFYTGDFLLSNSRLVDGLPLEELRGLRPDVLIVEGSYGTARYPHRKQQENQLAERISRAMGDRQSILLPTPTLGLGQELLMLLRSHHHFTGQDLDIWVDGTIALGCDAYLEMLPHFPSSVQNFARHQPLFWDERIRPRVRRLPPHASLQSPCIVLTDQDKDLSQYLLSGKNSPSWLILIPHQPSQIGSVELTFNQTLQDSPALQAAVQAGRITPEPYLLADHCDGAGTTQLIHNLRPQHVVFIHGAPAYLNDLTSLEELHNRYHLHTPAAGIKVKLPIGETFLQPAPPETQYEGELTEHPDSVLISLPETVTADPRWQNLADTGIVEVRWQGEELVLRGMTQRELLRKNQDMAVQTDVECCENCIHCRSQRCWNQASPLFGFKVTPDGYCPVFEAAQWVQPEA
ncbi:MAG: MBL fold metallo-hydrolase [Leptolyngbyaceae cyanobacterium CSU_1_4]|nr:MBL fold metallo-hydrolase [Leptolyngbyaceae cyanobacterium CSU_1_4]